MNIGYLNEYASTCKLIISANPNPIPNPNPNPVNYVQKLEPGAKRVGRERGLRRHLARLHVERRGLYSVLPVYLRVSQPQPRYTAVLFYIYIRMFLQTLFFI